jgi:hypothetical protein
MNWESYDLLKVIPVVRQVSEKRPEHETKAFVAGTKYTSTVVWRPHTLRPFISLSVVS